MPVFKCFERVGNVLHDFCRKRLHYDPAHILFTGAYEQAIPRDRVVRTRLPGSDTDTSIGISPGRANKTGKGPTPVIRSDGTLEPAHITTGRAMDDVPNGSRMIHVGLGVIVDEYRPMPICGHTIDGNQNGRTAVHEQTELLRKHLPTLKHYDVAVLKHALRDDGDRPHERLPRAVREEHGG